MKTYLLVLALLLTACTTTPQERLEKKAYERGVRFLTSFLRNPDGAKFQSKGDVMFGMTNDTLRMFMDVTATNGYGGTEKVSITLVFDKDGKLIDGMEMGEWLLNNDMMIRQHNWEMADSLSAEIDKLDPNKPKELEARIELRRIEMDYRSRITPVEPSQSSIFKSTPSIMFVH